MGVMGAQVSVIRASIHHAITHHLYLSAFSNFLVDLIICTFLLTLLISFDCVQGPQGEPGAPGDRGSPGNQVSANRHVSWHSVMYDDVFQLIALKWRIIHVLSIHAYFWDLIDRECRETLDFRERQENADIRSVTKTIRGGGDRYNLLTINTMLCFNITIFRHRCIFCENKFRC